MNQKAILKQLFTGILFVLVLGQLQGNDLPTEINTSNIVSVALKGYGAEERYKNTEMLDVGRQNPYEVLKDIHSIDSNYYLTIGNLETEDKTPNTVLEFLLAAYAADTYMQNAPTEVSYTFKNTLGAVSLARLSYLSLADRGAAFGKNSDYEAAVDGIIEAHQFRYEHTSLEDRETHKWRELSRESLQIEYNNWVAGEAVRVAMQEPEFKGLSEAQVTKIIQPLIDYYTDPTEANMSRLKSYWSEMGLRNEQTNAYSGALLMTTTHIMKGLGLGRSNVFDQIYAYAVSRIDGFATTEQINAAYESRKRMREAIDSIAVQNK